MAENGTFSMAVEGKSQALTYYCLSITRRKYILDGGT